MFSFGCHQYPTTSLPGHIPLLQLPFVSAFLLKYPRCSLTNPHLIHIFMGPGKFVGESLSGGYRKRRFRYCIRDSEQADKA